MTELRDYSITASANSSITVGDGGFPEGTIRIKEFNDAARAMQALFARWRNDTRGVATLTADSNSRSFNISLSQTLSPSGS